MKYLKILAVSFCMILLLLQFTKFGRSLWDWFPPQDAGFEYSESFKRLLEAEKGIALVSMILTMVMGIVLVPLSFLVGGLFEMFGFSQYKFGALALWLTIFIASVLITVVFFCRDRFNQYLDKKYPGAGH